MARLPTTLQVSYLILIPKTAAEIRGKREELHIPKDAPYFFYHDIEFLSLGKKHLTLDSIPVEITMEMLDGKVFLTECRYTLTDAFSSDAVQRKESIELQLRQHFMNEEEHLRGTFEEYSIFLLQDPKISLDEFVARQAAGLARLLRALDKPLDDQELTRVLESRVRYSDEDMVLVDWNGALSITKDGDFQSDIDLFKVGNFQLLRYRLLNQTLDTYLQTLHDLLTRPRRGFLPQKDQLMYEIVKKRLILVLEFERVEQSLLQIGDWYSAQVYRTIYDEFYLDEWKATVHTKLHSLGEIYEVVTQNLSFSWSRFLDLMQLAGWLILLVGYFVLFFFDVQKAS